MGCESYEAEGKIIRFDDDDVDCLCTLNSEVDLHSSDIKSLAFLGLAIILIRRGELAVGEERVYLPSDLPKEQVESITRIGFPAFAD